jgi:thiamine-phosphate pyrophosphorylase
MPSLPQGVYAIADGSAGRPMEELVRAFVAGGAAVVQLRVKQPATGELLQLARAARKLCAGKALFFMNDRPDIARLARADGVHLGQDDLPLAEARKIVGPEMIIGISTHSDEEIDAAQGADYIGFGPVFATSSKPGAPLPPPQGIEGLERAVHRSRIPVVAIGGITAENADEVAATGARCAAAIAAVCKAPDPEAAVRSMAGRWRLGAGGRRAGAGGHP